MSLHHHSTLGGHESGLGSRTHTQTLQSCTLPKEPCPRTFLNSNWRGSAFSDPSFTWWVMLISLNCMSSCQIQTRSYSERTSAQWSVRNQQKNVVSSHFYLLICTKRYIKKQAKKEDVSQPSVGISLEYSPPLTFSYHSGFWSPSLRGTPIEQ